MLVACRDDERRWRIMALGVPRLLRSHDDGGRWVPCASGRSLGSMYLVNTERVSSEMERWQVGGLVVDERAAASATMRIDESVPCWGQNAEANATPQVDGLTVVYALRN